MAPARSRTLSWIILNIMHIRICYMPVPLHTLVLGSITIGTTREKGKLYVVIAPINYCIGRRCS
jgi:hypothetical protein